jgi:uncharacterized protein (DUF2252 family)
MSQPPIPPEGRADALREARNLKMASSQHAYVRGSTVKFYEWLDASSGKVPTGPAVWICGDCHIGNLGPLADADGVVDVQIRDLDQTVIGNPAHDIIRLALSLASMSRSLDLPGVTVARMLEEITAGYAQGLTGRGNAEERPEIITTLLKRAGKRRWKHLAEERIEDVKPTIPLGKRFWTLHDDERQALNILFASDPPRADIAAWRGLKKPERLELLDAAYWMKGCSSLGRLRYAALVGDANKPKTDPSLIDIKEAVKAAAPHHPNADAPRDNAERVVAGARALSPNLGERMVASKLLGKSVVLRELMPQDLKPDFDTLAPEEAMSVARYLARVVGMAHGRQMSGDVRRSWRGEIDRSRSRSIEAPTWLWTSVVELVSVHEAAYLEHCRRYALAQAA